MVFPKKRQARAWCLSSVYRHLVRFEDFRSVDCEIVDEDQLAAVFYDDTIFVNKGDIPYFKQLYNAVSMNFNALQSIAEVLFGDPRARSSLTEAVLLCGMAEILYMGISNEIVIAEYSILMKTYGEEIVPAIFNKLLEINAGKITSMCGRG